MTEATARRRYRKLEGETKDGLILIGPSGDRKMHRSLVELDATAGAPPVDEQAKEEDNGQPRLL